ncbi:MAG TPA: ABC transporter permease subunit [Tepidisphaeraceae bacterium]|nr:ABC transporter permease subunit [Tepidisphaeraceae bacterium]
MLGISNYLWRLIPANPILVRVVQAGGKRKRDLLIRCAYLGILLFLVIFLLLQSAGSLASASLSDLSKQSSEIFYWMSYAQLALVALLAPIFTAGAITQEKDSQTYDILLATPLTNGQIVLGSLLSRLFFVVTLLISGIPIFAITQIFGGVAISSITMSFLIACATAFVTGALAMAIAVFKVGTRRTIFSFYLFIMLYLAIPLALEKMGYLQYQWSFDSAGKAQTHISWFAGIHPFLALRVIFGEPAYRPPEAGMVQGYSWPWNWYLSSPQTFYITFMFLLSLVLVTPSIFMLRRLAQSTNTMRGWLMQKLHISKGDRTRKPRHVWSNPIAWREAKTKASANRAVILRYGFMTAGLIAAIVLVVMSSTQEPASVYIGAGGYNPNDKTLTIMENGAPSVYLLRDRFESGRAPTKVQMGEQQLGIEDLREGMVITSYLPDSGAAKKVLGTLNVAYPQMLLSDKRTRQFLLGAVMIELAVILLILTQSAASTVTREKEDGTLDLLLSTPITSRYYVWGKLRGLVSFVLPLVAVPIISVLIFVFHDMIRSTPWAAHPLPWTVFPEAILILPATLVMVSAFAAILGMQMSLRCRKTVVAVMSSVGIVAGVCGGLWVCGINAAGSSIGSPGLIVGCFSPFTLMAILVNPMDVASGSFSEGDSAEGRLLVFVFGWAAAALYAFVVWGMYKSMVRNFDMTIRKQST